MSRRSDYNSRSNSKRYHASFRDRQYHDAHSSKRRKSNSPDKQSKPDVQEVVNKNKYELTAFLQDRLNIRDKDDFWKFFNKYQTIQANKANSTDFDKTKLLNINFSSKSSLLYDQLPIRLNRDVFQSLLNAVLVYQDFQQKSKFSKLKKLRTAQNELPIAQYKEKILGALQESRVVLIAGDTGCGKSTQVPQYVIEAGYNKVVCTQPRRIACVSLAKRVAYETLTDFKTVVGYQIRFEKTKRADTSVVFMTEGLLLRQAAEEETINAYDVIILDEIHERHLFGDFLIGIMKCLLHKRDNFKLVLMSATINIQLFEDYFADEGVKVIQVPGRLYPIEIQYKPIIKDPYERKSDRFDCRPYLQIIQMIDDKYPPNRKGDLLVFLNGIAEITSLSEAVVEYSNIKKNWIVLQLHSTLSLEEQDKVFDYPPEGVRKCIISTNIAETSVTIDGVRFVVDSGKVNRMIYHTTGGINKLTETNISQDSAKQRCGRAGRTGPGTCFRLYSEEDFSNFDAYTTAEIHLVPLESLLLHMISLGLGNIQNFPFLEKPSSKAIEESVEKLKFCGALKLNEEFLVLTPLGEALSRLPVELTIGKMLIMSTVFGNVNSVLAMAAILSVQSPLTQQAYRSADMQNERKALESNHGDPISLLNMYKEWLCIKQDTVPVSRSSKQKETSKSWARKRGLEEQRFYEVTKLIQQFRDILEDAQLLPKGPDQELSSQERSIRHGELKQLRILRRNLKEESRSVRRKQLKYDAFNVDSDDIGPQKLDIRDIEFRIINDFKKLQKLLDESSPESYKDLMMLKLIITSGLYPQVSVEDEFNYSKSVSERLYHTKSKNFVFLRPLSCFTTNPEVLELHGDDIEVPPKGYFSKRPISRKHQILIYQSILETKKESAAVQMLLETCLEITEDRELPGQILALQEVRSLVCCYIHQVFIVDTTLAKLVHFQGYQSQLLEVTVKGVPSMHICLDFLLELMQQPNINKQIFAIQLLSHLSTQYSLPKSLNLCITALNLLYALLGAISSKQRIKLYKPVLPALVRISEAFPPLVDDIVQLLILLSRVCNSQASLPSYFDRHSSYRNSVGVEETKELCELAEETFTKIINKTVLKTNVYN